MGYVLFGIDDGVLVEVWWIVADYSLPLVLGRLCFTPDLLKTDEIMNQKIQQIFKHKWVKATLNPTISHMTKPFHSLQAQDFHLQMQKTLWMIFSEMSSFVLIPPPPFFF